MYLPMADLLNILATSLILTQIFEKPNEMATTPDTAYIWNMSTSDSNPR